MRIFVDADACPNVIKEILYRAAERTQTQLILVANKFLDVPRLPFIKAIKVSAGFDVADNRIIQEVQAGDLVITADIPLADAVINKGGIALNPRGQLYTIENIKERLVMRNLLEQLRNNNEISGGPAVFSKSDRQNFANQLDRLLTQRHV